MKIRLLGGYQNTRLNSEDFAITPYLFAVNTKEEKTRIIGLGLCWFYSAVFISIIINPPINWSKSFIILNKNNNESKN